MNVSNVICGVDEAGKGSVLGPMVIAGVGAKSPDIFLEISVKDSKKLTPACTGGPLFPDKEALPDNNVSD